nr:MAG TPA: hypothetical protein [Caudoviricetes sp.]
MQNNLKRKNFFPCLIDIIIFILVFILFSGVFFA